MLTLGQPASMLDIALIGWHQFAPGTRRSGGCACGEGDECVVARAKVKAHSREGVVPQVDVIEAG